MSSRLVHYPVLLAATALLTLPNLGAHSLWDMDEGVNAECTREMLEAGTWIVPTFNGELRTAKPVMLYWIQRPFLSAFGPTEWAARFPAALLGMGTVLLVYELGRRMFGAATGFLGGLVLASATQFCILSHAATPDAPLIFFTVLTFLLFWRGHENGGRGWFTLPAIASGLAVLTKGPIGLALPGLVVLLYFAWNRELKRVLDRRLIWGVLLWAVVALPWYGLVTSETRGAYIGKFLGNENVNRFFVPQENHRGPAVYYVVVLFLMFAPWCCFLGATLWYAVRGARTQQSPPVATGGLSPEIRAARFLLCWFGAYLVFFSAAQTKLPNYIGPLYPAVALLTARFLILWRDGAIAPARWVMPVGIGGVAFVGLVTVIGMLLAGGELPITVPKMRIFPGLGPWAAVGLIPLAAAAVMAWCLRTANRPGLVTALTTASVVWVGVVAAGPILAIDRQKAAKELVATSGAHQPERDIRLAATAYFQESLVFYAERRVERLYSVDEVLGFLTLPRPGYLFVPEKEWQEQLAGRMTVPVRIAAKKYDFYRNAEILVVTNEL
jgi:4-amino-4-deoxy-L-arabinose transferase-like glycosyltransferase